MPQHAQIAHSNKAIVGSSWVLFLTVLQILLSWQGAHVGKKRKKIWLTVHLCLFWILWPRNRAAFENESFCS